MPPPGAPPAHARVGAKCPTGRATLTVMRRALVLIVVFTLALASPSSATTRPPDAVVDGLVEAVWDVDGEIDAPGNDVTVFSHGNRHRCRKLSRRRWRCPIAVSVKADDNPLIWWLVTTEISVSGKWKYVGVPLWAGNSNPWRRRRRPRHFDPHPWLR